VLNAARSWRFAETGEWWSKEAAGEWARDRTAHPAVVEAALADRRGGDERVRLTAGDVAAVLDEADAAVDRAR
jgi:hypothetical protein